MSGFLGDLPLWAVLVFFLFGFPAVTVALQALIRRLFPELRAKRHNEVAGYLVAVIGVIYAVTVGFMIADQWDNYTDARQRTWQEAYTLATIAEGSVVMPPRVQIEVRQAVVDYNRAVIEWWPQQDRTGVTGGLREKQTLEHLFQILNEAHPTTGAQRAFIEQANKNLLDVVADRDQRLNGANRAHLEGPLWMIMSIAGGVTILFCLLFGLENPGLHYAMVAGVAMVVGISFLLVTLLNYPLSGVMPIAPESYESVVRDLTR